jgi:uncharacterized protein with PIN domain
MSVVLDASAIIAMLKGGAARQKLRRKSVARE